MTRPGAPLTLRGFGLTDRGVVRPKNEDNFLIADLVRTLWVRQCSLPQPDTQHAHNRGHVFLVADGMGGHSAGEVASALSLESVETFALNWLKRFSNIQTAEEQGVLKDFQAALRQADARIFEEVAHHPELRGMGTTLTMAFVSGETLFVFHAGDSRCYLFHDATLRQLTSDHTVAAELARRGVIDPEEARHHRWRHVVTNVLGGAEIGVQVEMLKTHLEPGDVLLLCTDGLTDMLPDERVAAVLAAESEPQAACERLVAEANQAGGRDNITCVVVHVAAA